MEEVVIHLEGREICSQEEDILMEMMVTPLGEALLDLEGILAILMTVRMTMLVRGVVIQQEDKSIMIEYRLRTK